VNKHAAVTLHNSTISGNDGWAIFGEGTSSLYSSTIVRNARGVRTQSHLLAFSSIVAENGNEDVYITSAREGLTGAANFVGSTNLTSIATGVLLSGQLHLTPLGDHSGKTRVHALLATSSMLDRGNNPSAAKADQRGAAREYPAGMADVGSYERQRHDDQLLYDGFEDRL
jgi:hypothetical protein